MMRDLPSEHVEIVLDRDTSTALPVFRGGFPDIGELLEYVIIHPEALDFEADRSGLGKAALLHMVQRTLKDTDAYEYFLDAYGKGGSNLGPDTDTRTWSVRNRLVSYATTEERYDIGRVRTYSPLASSLFSIPGLVALELKAYSLRVTKAAAYSWDEIIPEMWRIVEEYCGNGKDKR